MSDADVLDDDIEAEITVVVVPGGTHLKDPIINQTPAGRLIVACTK